jgi:hypothetical protein
MFSGYILAILLGIPLGIMVGYWEKVYNSLEFVIEFFREDIIHLLEKLKLDYVDCGTDSTESVDYPDFGIQVAEKVSNEELDRGILICGTGIGMSIVANKFRGVRAPWPVNSTLPGAAGSITTQISWCWEGE